MREIKKLGELGDVFIGLTYKPEDVVDEDGTIVLRSSNIQDGKLDFGDIVRVSCNVRDKLWVKENDILMCSRNGSAKLVGKTALISNLQEDMTFGAFMTIIRTPYNGYLQYFFKSPMFRRQLNSSATTTINQITRSMLDNIDVPAFDNDTADNIKVILGKCEKIIQERKVEINALDDLIKARFVELFGNILCDRELPLVQLKELVNIGSSKRIYANEYVELGIPFYRSKEIRELGAGLKPSVELFIKQERYNEIKEKYGVPKIGDILIAAIGATIGYSWIVDSENPFYYKDGNLIILSNKGNVNSIFLNHALGILIEDYKNKGVAGSAQLALTIEKLEKMMVVNPKIELQNQFANFVKQVDKSKVAVQKALNKTQLLFDSLMQKYFE